MKNLKRTLFCICIALYFAGVAAGCVYSLKVDNQSDMFTFLKQGVINYDKTLADVMKSTAADNLKLMAVAAVGCLFKYGFLLIGAAVFYKGYLTGFCVLVLMRCYGMGGMIFGVANVFSDAFIVISAGFAAASAADYLISCGTDRRSYVRHYFVLMLLVFGVCLADIPLKGLLSTAFMSLARKIVLFG